MKIIWPEFKFPPINLWNMPKIKETTLSVDSEIKRLMRDVLENGEWRDTRSGKVLHCWDNKFKWDMREGFPAVTSKKLAWQTCVGEAIWFLSKSEWVQELKYYTFANVDSDKWTIWTDDADRWNKERGRNMEGYVGALYPTQWRDYNYSGIDQIQNLIKGLKESPHERNHLVVAWNPEAIANNEMALKPCHIGFQCHVSNDGYLDLKWTQRSSDLFLGAPMNIASYGFLLTLFAEWCNLKPRYLSCDLGDYHIYENHLDAVGEYLSNKEHSPPQLLLPEKAKEGLDDLLTLTALDFKDSLKGYKHSGAIKAPLSVG